MAHRPRMTYCNPLNLAYRFQVPNPKVACRREAADPSVIAYRGRYWLFASKSGGYWFSDDLLEWTFVATDKLPTEDYAPDVRVINDWVYFTASRHNPECPVFRSQALEEDQWELVGERLIYWDPNMFQDDDGRVYLYYGSSNKDPLYGLELDPETMGPNSDTVQVIQNHQQTEHGWERYGVNNATMDPPWLEGAWMTKHGGRYYLQYAAAGTEFDVYADGVYIGDAPLGPFGYAEHNPFSLKPGGFIGGAGHGSTFQDRHGNWWHTSTMCVSVHHKFERRLGLWPAGFDEDGVLFCNTRFGDYPTRVHDGPFDPWADSFGGWMLLSYRKPVTVSSAVPGRPGECIADESVRTWWAAADGDSTPSISVDLEARPEIRAVQINFAEDQCEQYCRAGDPLFHRYVLEASEDGETWFPLADKRERSEDVPHDYLEFDTGVCARYVRLTIHHMPGQGRPAVRGLRIFGRADGDPPSAPANLDVSRNPDDPCQVRLSWPGIPAADGYNIRWGIAADKLYSDWLVYDQTELRMNCLTAGQEYVFAIEAFNASGVSPLSAAVRSRSANAPFANSANSSARSVPVYDRSPR